MRQHSDELIERCAEAAYAARCAEDYGPHPDFDDLYPRTQRLWRSYARAVIAEYEAAKPAPGDPKMRDNDQPLRYCSYCRAWSSKPCGEGCHWEPTMPTPDFGRRNSPLLYTAAKKALNFIENTESELGIKLDSGNDLRSAIQHAIGHLYPPEPTVPEVQARVDGEGE